jgi:dihydrofolate reductase
LIWHLPVDLKHFKNHTAGKTIIMGRKTWDSLGGRPLPKRRHIVISRNPDFSAQGCESVQSLEAALALVQEEAEAFIVGGAQIYELSLPHLDQLEITVVDASLEGDAFFPDWDKSNYELVASEYHPVDENHEYSFTFETWKRKG